MENKKRLIILLGVAGVILAVAIVVFRSGSPDAAPIAETADAVRQMQEESKGVESPPPATPSTTGRMRKAVEP